MLSCDRNNRLSFRANLMLHISRILQRSLYQLDVRCQRDAQDAQGQFPGPELILKAPRLTGASTNDAHEILSCTAARGSWKHWEPVGAAQGQNEPQNTFADDAAE